MPSLVSTSVFIDFDSSTVMTPSLPTFSIAMRDQRRRSLCRWPRSRRPARSSPRCVDLLDELLHLVDGLLDRLLDAALDQQRVRAGRDVAKAFADDRLREHGRGGGAVAGDVVGLGSDFLDELRAHVLERSGSSISLAMVTPSLVIVGEPNFLSRTTLRPFGPSVTLTASARMFAPRSSARRALSSNTSSLLPCFSVTLRRNALVGDDRENVFFRDDEVLFAFDFDFAARVLRVDDAVADFTSIGSFVPLSSVRPVPTARTRPSWGFSLAVSGRKTPPALLSACSTCSTTTRSPSGLRFTNRRPAEPRTRTLDEKAWAWNVVKISRSERATPGTEIRPRRLSNHSDTERVRGSLSAGLFILCTSDAAASWADGSAPVLGFLPCQNSAAPSSKAHPSACMDRWGLVVRF
jgi:hypothetical protein